MLEEALKYLKMGFAPIPLCSAKSPCLNATGKCTGGHGKVPLISWKEFEKRFPTEAEVRQWWKKWPHANIGLVTGEISGIDVLDVDPRNGGNESIQGKHLPPTPSQKTGAGGEHYFYRHSSGLSCKPGFLPGLDLKADGGYVVLAPSIHPNGTAYAFHDGLELNEIDLTEKPKWILDHADGKHNNNGLASAGEYAEILRGVPAGQRNSACTRLAGRYLAKGLSQAEARRFLLAWNQSNNPPMDVSEVETVLQSIIRTDQRNRPAGQVAPEAKIEYNKIRVEVTREEYATNDQAIKALANDPEIYSRGGALVSIQVPSQEWTENEIWRPAGSAIIRTLPSASLRERLTTVANFVETQGNKEKNVHPPAWCVNGVFARGRWRGIRPLRGVISSPAFLPNGEILFKPGYDTNSGLFYCNGDLPDNLGIPDFVSQPDARQAADVLLDLISDFPFAGQEHRAAWIAALLTIPARYAFDGPTPLFLIDANTRGSGKSLLADLISLITTGREAARMSLPDDDAEMRKRITSMVLSGDSLVLFDNLETTLGGPSLNAALTGSFWKDRLLGKNEVIEAPLQLICLATGNNAEVDRDTVRRILWIRLNSDLEAPELRDDFKYPRIRDQVKQHRTELLRATLSILKGYHQAGHPAQDIKPWGSFEEWTSLVSGALVWAGLSDPTASREELRTRADQEAATLSEILRGLEEMDPNSTGFTTAEILKTLKENDGKFDTLRHAVAELCGTAVDKLPSVKQLGTNLGRLRGRVVSGQSLEAKDAHGNLKKWSVAKKAQK